MITEAVSSRPIATAIPYTLVAGFTKSWQTAVSRTGKWPDLYLRAPASVEACREAAKATLRQPRPWPELAAILRNSSLAYGVPGEVVERLDLLAAGKAVMVVTGQQVGYLGGPLFTFVKAYHAVRLADHLEKELRIPVLPMFWLEGRDHDLAEVRDANYLNAAGELKTLRFQPDAEVPGFEVGRYRVSAEEHIQELAAALETPHEAGLQLLAGAYSDTTLTDGMGRLLGSILGPRGLIIAEGMDPQLKALASPLWEKVIGLGSHLTDIFYARAKELEKAGWNAPMTPTHDAHLFYLTREHRRASLTYSGQLKHPDGHTEQISDEEVLDLVRRDPDAISPKAALRPPYQDYILPTVAYVAGPGEMDYHAQLTPFYREFGITAPSLFPRMSVTVADHKVQRHLEKLELSVADVLSHTSRQLMTKLLRDEDHGHTAKLFEESRAEIQAIFDRLKKGLTEIDPTLAATAETGAGRALHPLDHLREKAEKALKQRHATTLSRLEKVLNALHPRDTLAERILGTGYYLAKYGPEKLLSALDQLPAVPTEHFVLTID